MLLNVKHTTSYTYDQPVVLGPHCLRLHPRPDSYFALPEYKLEITPTPSQLIANVENDGSISQWAWFKGETTVFQIKSTLLISLNHEKNPFDFMITPSSCVALPMVYPSEIFRELRNFLTVENSGPRLRDFAFDIVAAAKGKTIDFLVLLAQTIKKDFVYEYRHAGAPHLPEDTLETRCGSCRDLAVLYMAVCRAAGLASRFVSGYYFDEQPSSPQLHAWAEVYIPGGGWRGFDPSLGLACYEHHIALTSASNPSNTNPIQGVYKGPAHAEMKLELEYRFSSEPVIR